MLELDFEQQLGDLHLQVNTQLPTEGITAVFGLSGAGKTSLINVIAGLIRPQKGRIALNDHVLVDIGKGICLPSEQRRIGYVFQDARLFPHYRVKGNLQYGISPEMKPEFDSIVSLLGIGHLLSRFPLTLSGGEKQRVAIGRALLTAPDLLLMDEPLASLDLPVKENYCLILKSFLKRSTSRFYMSAIIWMRFFVWQKMYSSWITEKSGQRENWKRFGPVVHYVFGYKKRRLAVF